MKKLVFAALAALGLLGGGYALSQTIGVPQVQSIGPTDLFQDIPGGAPVSGNVYANAALLGNYGTTLAGNNPENWLIGGDATTNLWQRGTTYATPPTITLAYGSADRWAAWSGASTSMNITQSTTAADLRPGYKAAFKLQRTSGQAGLVQMCMMQVLESVNSYAFQSGTAEVDFEAVTGANFSAANGNMTVYYITGTGIDGSASTAAFNLNGGGGGSSLWTGQVNTGVVISLGGTGTSGRYGAVFPTSATTTQVAVALCYTPVGTALTNDYIAFGNIQLTRNSALTPVAGTAGAALAVNDTRAKQFSRRSQALESVLQYRYTYKITETSGVATMRGTCTNLTSSISNCIVPFPVVMRAVPTMTYTTGFAIAVAAQTSVTSCTANATSTTATSLASPLAVLMSCATSAAGGALGTSTTWGDNNSTGSILASAEL